MGYLFYVAVMSAGYYYNLTFVQLGLIDLGERLVGMSGQRVSLAMAGFALGAFVAAVFSGRLMDARGWSAAIDVKLKMLVGVVGVQTLLTVIAPLVATPAQFAWWVGICSVTIGAGIPVTFSFMSDFIAVPHRGTVAAVVAGLAFFAAALYPLEWRLEDFARVMTMAMVPAWLVLVWVAFGRSSIIDALAHQRQHLGPGRFCRNEPTANRGFEFWSIVLVMFFVFFIDSLGFLRIIDEPAYISTSWQSMEVPTRLFIALSHVIGAGMAGVLYTAFGRRWLLTWVFGLFAFAHLLYTFHIRTAPAGFDPPLVLPLFYVLAVSFYTTLNFALWPDLSTSRNVGTNAALGVGIAGWLASFLSTSLALYSKASGISLLQHLTYVNALALLLAVGYPVALYVREMRRLSTAGSAS